MAEVEPQLGAAEMALEAEQIPSSSPVIADAPPLGKNRFSLNVLRLPFSSPRKHSTDKAATVEDVVNSSNPELEATDGAPTSAAKESEATEDATALPSETLDSKAASSEQRPLRSALAAPTEASSRRKTSTSSPHRVSFSPSTEQMANARDQATLLAVPTDAGVAQAGRSKPKTHLPKWRGLKSRSTDDLRPRARRHSLESMLSASSVGSTSTMEHFEDAAALQGAAAVKRRLFRWDRKGIHHSDATAKGKVAKVKVTKTQAVAARHAKTLEQVINAGMGLHPIPARLSSAVDRSAAEADALAAGGKKKKSPRVKPVPVVDRSQLKGLKSALLDADAANDIIKALRSMPVPLDVLRTGLGHMIPDAQIGTAGDHGQERILTANLPDTVLEGNVTKDDSEIRKRPGATAEALDESTPARPPIPRKAKSAAEEALRKITLQADASTSPKKAAVVTARTSSLPPAEEAVAPRLSSETSAVPAPQTQAASVPSGARPLKMVCLDCGELEAHKRHAQHFESAAVVTDASGASASNGGFNVTTIATGAAVAFAGVGELLTARSALNPQSAPDSPADKEQEPSTRPIMLKSMSVSNLPSLQDGPRLMGTTPIQLILDPVGTVAQNSGAFDMLATVSGTAIRATQDMDAIHPPIDRMAIFVHWWGFEITLPKASMAYLGTAHSVSGAFLSFLQTMAVSGGVPELLPFIKYISTFMEVEYKAIQAQDQGHGVCIAGTWFMPMALVPRPWDYPLDGPVAEKPNAGAPAPSAATSVAQNVAASPKKHVFKKKKSAKTAPNAEIAQPPAVSSAVEAPGPTTSSAQTAAVQAARTDKMPQDLSPRHSPSSSIVSAKDVQLFAQLTSVSNNTAAASSAAQAEAGLSSVQEVPEAGSQIKV